MRCKTCNRYFENPGHFYGDRCGFHLCKQCTERENMSKCRECGRTFLTGDFINYGHQGCCCSNRLNCFNRRKKTMPNIKITAEVDGKQVPLEAISTKTFEAIKMLQKPKEIPVPVAEIGYWGGRPDKPRLLLRITDSLKYSIIAGDPYKVAIDLKDGDVMADWVNERDVIRYSKQYENVKPL